MKYKSSGSSQKVKNQIARNEGTCTVTGTVIWCSNMTEKTFLEDAKTYREPYPSHAGDIHYRLTSRASAAWPTGLLIQPQPHEKKRNT